MWEPEVNTPSLKDLFLQKKSTLYFILDDSEAVYNDLLEKVEEPYLFVNLDYVEHNISNAQVEKRELLFSHLWHVFVMRGYWLLLTPNKRVLAST